MVFENIAKGNQQTRDSIGSNPSILPIPKIFKEELRIHEEPLVIYDRDIDNSWIVGSSTNGIVGTWTGTVGGGQLVVGDTTNTQALLRVESGDTYKNFLRNTPTNMDDTVVDYGLLNGTTTTGTLTTSSNRIDLDNTEVIEWRIKYNDGTVSKVTVVFDEDAGRTNIDFSTDVTIEVTANGGSNWTTVTNKTQAELTPGTDVRMRITASANSLYWKTANTQGKEVPIQVKFV